MKDLGHWVFEVKTKNLNYIITMYNAIKNNFRNIFVPTVVSIAPDIFNKKVENWRDVDNIISKHKKPIYSIRFEDIKFSLKSLKDTNVILVHTSQPSTGGFCVIGISTASMVWLKPENAKALENALRGIARDLGIEPEFETERPDIVEVWQYGLKKKEPL